MPSLTETASATGFPVCSRLLHFSFFFSGSALIMPSPVPPVGPQNFISKSGPHSLTPFQRFTLKEVRSAWLGQRRCPVDFANIWNQDWHSLSSRFSQVQRTRARHAAIYDDVRTTLDRAKAWVCSLMRSLEAWIYFTSVKKSACDTLSDFFSLPQNVWVIFCLLYVSLRATIHLAKLIFESFPKKCRICFCLSDIFFQTVFFLYGGPKVHCEKLEMAWIGRGPRSEWRSISICYFKGQAFRPDHSLGVDSNYSRNGQYDLVGIHTCLAVWV